MIKKRKMILLGLVLALVIGFFVGNGQTSALTLCTVVGSSQTQKEFCYGELYRNSNEVQKKCGSSFSDAACISALRTKMTCNSVSSDACKSAIKDYVENVNTGLIAIVRKNNIPPCDKLEGDKKEECKLGKDGTNNWKFYYASESEKNAAVAEKEKTDEDKDKDKDEDEDDGVDPAVPHLAPTERSGECTSILGDEYCNGGKNGQGILKIIRLVISILTGAVVVVGSVGIVVCGVLWMTARDNEGQIAKAKKRLLEIVIGMIAFILFGLLANLLIPKSSDDINGEIKVSAITEEVKNEKNNS
jgi:hypothetical protein